MNESLDTPEPIEEANDDSNTQSDSPDSATEDAAVADGDEKKLNPLFSDEAEDDVYDYEDLDDEESRAV
ncbi:MAG: hypothetical protein CMJ82_13985, partial [Planctomycetaceae bacterium]|nr:hypothetical protein [Planctomycetaceae bacterium]